MPEIMISKKMARQFAHECFDAIIQEIQEQQIKDVKENAQLCA